MKKLLILSLLFSILCSCANETDNSKTKYKSTDKNYKAIGTDGRPYDVIVIDSSLFPEVTWETDPRKIELNLL